MAAQRGEFYQYLHDVGMKNLPDRQRWPEIESANAVELLLHLGKSPLAERYISDEIAWVITDVDSNDYNGVCWARLPDDSADRIIADTLNRFRSQNVPMLWYVTPDSRPADLGERLLAHGCFALSPGTGMAADLQAINEEARDVPGLVIERVTDAAMLAQWGKVYDYDPCKREPLFASLGLDGERPFRHYLALLDGQPVGTASLFLGKEAADLNHVEVIPWARRRGIGTAVTLSALQEARAAGYQLAVLGPSPEGYRMYERMGFKAHTGIQEWYTLPWEEV
jgi:predicted GNAT family acetyltransferase